MKIAIKIIISLAVLLGWQVLSGDLGLACILAVFVLAVLIANPKKEKSFEESDEYKSMVKEKNERKLFLEERAHFREAASRAKTAAKQNQSKGIENGNFTFSSGWNRAIYAI